MRKRSEFRNPKMAVQMKLSPKISFEAFCRDVLHEAISRPWVVAFKAFDGLPLANSDELEIWRAMSGREEYTPRDYRELVAVKGRRAQGTKTATKFLAYKIHTSDFRRYAAKGDRLHVPIISQNRDISKEIMSYLTGFYSESDLRTEVAEVFKASIELKNRFVFTVATCSYRSSRGLNTPLGCCDELGVWPSEGADVDREVIKSLTPGMVQFPNRKLILLGSPWVKSGILYDRFERRFEEGGERLVLHCPTPLMNTTIPSSELERERQSDPQNFRREFLAEWLADVDQFLPDSDITAAVQAGIRERPFAELLKGQYVATIDASGLSGKDRFVLALGHKSVRGSSAGVSLDLLRTWSRQSVKTVCDEIAMILKAYGLKALFADQFGYPFVKELLSLRGIEAEQLAWTGSNKGEIFLAMKLALSQGNLRLLDHQELLRELRMLECTRTSGGHTAISAPRGSQNHDDHASAVAALNWQCRKNRDAGWGFVITANGVLR